MSKQEDRSRKIAKWLEHLRGWRDSGQSLLAYAKDHGLAVWAIYHWRRVLIEEGRWQELSNALAQASRAHERPAVAPQFARIAVVDSSRSAPIIVRVVLANGRSAEIEVRELDQFVWLPGHPLPHPGHWTSLDIPGHPPGILPPGHPPGIHRPLVLGHPSTVIWTSINGDQRCPSTAASIINGVHQRCDDPGHMNSC